MASDCGQPLPTTVQLSLREFAEQWSADGLFYLRDLHLVAARTPGCKFVQPAFAPDWLGRCFDTGGVEGASDLRFVYCGAAGTKTPTHVDIMETFSWSWSLCGRKRWRMWSPKASFQLLDCWGERFAAWPHDCSSVLHPRARAAPCLEFWQQAGEVVFVPSGWAHNVVNEADTLSVSCNWLNEHNVLLCTAAVLAEQMACSSGASAAQKLSDCLFYTATDLEGCACDDTALARRRIQSCLRKLPRPTQCFDMDASKWASWLGCMPGT